MTGENNRKGVLVVDDAAFSRGLIKKIIDELDFAEVIGEASNGNEAVALYSELHPDLVTMDIVMPEKDGITAIGEILKIDKNATIVVVTAAGQEQLIMEATEAGAREFVQKPFKRDKLISIFKNFLLNK